MNRRQASHTEPLAVVRALATLCLTLGTLALCAAAARAEVAETLSSNAETIHHEVLFYASPARVYAALTSSKQFAGVVRLSAAITSGMVPAGKPTVVSAVAGGTFSAFGGYITGRQLELVPNQRIVQAWRAGSWDPGSWSIARFELSAQGADSTRLVFDHTGFPAGQAAHLAEGWRTNYWEPLAKYLDAHPALAAAKAK